jgi:acyl-coenzyme A synthetase/AMP-(fatty) acid ligase
LNRGNVPIGRPIANTQVYILDAQFTACSVGVLGELYIGGAGLSRGYLNRPELTQRTLFLNPFAENRFIIRSSSFILRLYKTGDLARYLPDGNIEFMGRIDHQVKIRGFRIELGEIEAAIGQHPAVRETVVLVREDNPGDKRLVAYIVSNSALKTQDSELINDLRCYLKQKLPQYMMPSAFVLLESLPLTTNGKIDRRSLRAPDIKPSGIREQFYRASNSRRAINSRNLG